MAFNYVFNTERTSKLSDGDNINIFTTDQYLQST